MMNNYNLLSWRLDALLKSEVGDSNLSPPSKRLGITKWLWGLLLVSCTFFMENLQAQIAVNETFDGTTTPTGWTYTSFSRSTEVPCTGAGAIRKNQWSSSTTGSAAAPLFTSTGQQLDISFSYKLLNYQSPVTSSTTALTNTVSWGSIITEVSTNGGTSYGITAGTINSTNHVVSQNCATINYTVPGSSLPQGSSCRVRFRLTFAGTTPDYYVYLDNVTINQVAPACSGTPVAGTISPASQNICTGVAPSAFTVSGSTAGVTGISFQWLQSTDGTNYGPAVGGTGASTATYTPPAFAGSTIYYLCRVACSNSGLSADTAPVTVSPPASPSTQATALAASSITYNGASLGWTNGNGARRVVFLSNSPIVDPVNGNMAAYTANTVYAGTGQQVVFDGTAATVSVTGLTLGTTYYVKVFEYLRCGAGPYDYYFNTTTGTNSTTFSTSSATALPWTEGFATTTLPTNWVNTGFTLGTGGTGGNPGNGIYKNIWSSATSGNFVTQILGVLPSNYRLTFDYRLGTYSDITVSPGAGSGNFVVAISTNSGSTYTDILTVPNNTITGWQSLSVDLSAYAGQNIRLRFSAAIVGTTPDYYIGFDNLSVNPIPTCYIPTGVTASNLTSSSVDVSWTAPATGTTPIEYEYLLSTSATPPTSGTAVTGTSVTGMTIVPLTTYYFHVRSVCVQGSDYSNWVTSSPIVYIPGDNCSSAIDLGTQTSPLSSTTVGATNDFSFVCNTNSDPDLIYYIDVPANYTLVIGQTVNGYDSENYLFYGGACPGTTQIACFDDPDIQDITWTNTTGSLQRVYWVQDGYASGNSGTFTLAWTLTPPPIVVTSFAPTAVCSADLATTTITLTGSNFTDATDVRLNGVSHSFVVVNDTTITVSLTSTSTAGVFTVYNAVTSGSSATPLTINVSPVVDPITGASNDLCMPNTLALANNTALGVWSSSNEAIATVNTSGVVTGVAEGTATISYTVTDNGCSTAVTYTVNVKAPVAIGSNPINQSVVTGNNISFSVSATGTGLSYQWEESTDGGLTYLPITNGGVYSGADTVVLTLTAVADTMNGYFYQCVVSGTSPCAPETSLAAMLTVGNTAIVAHPTNFSLCDTGTATFTVVATGGVDTYQWYQDSGLGAEPLFDGGNVSGANSDTLTLTGVDTSYNGYTYYVEVVGPANTVYSNSATLFVNTPATITTNPTAQTVCYTGGVATFTAAAGGTFTGVQWQYSTDNSSWSNVVNATPVGVTYNGATTSTLTVTTTATTPALGTYYYRMIALASSPCTNALSAGAQLMINNPSITAQPTAATVLAGATATFTASSNATGVVTYQWQRATTLNGTYTNVVNGTPANVTYNGANTATLSVVTTSATAASTANFYRLVVTSDGCAVNSTGAQLTINNYCAIPTSTSSASYFNSFATTGGVTNITNSASGFSTGGYGNFTAQSASQLQGQPVSFTTALVGTTVGVAIWVDWNQNATFETTERVYNTGAYVSTASGSFTVPATALPGTTRMRIAMDYNATSPLACPATGARREVEDYSFTVLVPPACSGTPVAGTVTASNASICFSGTSTLTLNGYSTGVTGITFQWYNSQGLIAGANSVSYTTPTLTSGESYYCRVSCTDSGLFANSNTVNLVVNTPALNSVTPGERCGTGTVVLGATGSAGSSINWYAASTGGAPIGTGTSFTTPSINATTTYYAEAVTGSSTINGARTTPAGTSSTTPSTYGLVFDATTAFTLNSVNVYPNGSAGNVTIQLQNSAGTALQTLSAYALPSGTGTTPVTVPLGWSITQGTGYRLVATTGTSSMVRDSAIGGFPYALGTAGTITSGYISGTSTTYYYFYNWSITVGCPSARQAVVATVNAPPALTLSSGTATICNGATTVTPVTITSTLADYDTYTWSPSTGVSGDINAGYLFNPTATTTYTLTASNSVTGCANAASFVVTVNPIPSLTVSPSTGVVCSNAVLPIALSSLSTANPTPVGGCTTAPSGLFPSTTYSALTCNGSTQNVITTAGYAGEYSNVNVTAGSLYVFSSSVSSDYLTITNAAGTVIYAAGVTPVTYYSNTAEVIRFYTHLDNACGVASVSRNRQFTCQASSGIPNATTWTPTTGLYTDVAGSVPYTGDSRDTVYARPTTTTTYTSTIVSGAGCSNTANTTITVTPATTYYADIDGDGFGNPSVTVASCTPIAGYVLNNTDCNDNQTRYEDLDGDGFGSTVKVPCGGVLNATDCNDNQLRYTDADGDGYGTLPLVACGGSTFNTDCNDAVAAINPGAVDVCYDGIDNDCNGNIDNLGLPGGCTPVVSSIPTASCGTTVQYGSAVYSSLVTGAQGYRYRVTRVNPADDSAMGAPVIVDMNLRNLYLSNLSNYAYNAKFKVEIAVKYNNVWQPNYSAPCYLFTPTPVSTMVSCGTQVVSLTTQVTSTSVVLATGYKYLVQRMNGASVVSSQEIVSGIRNFSFSQVTDLRYDAFYSVSCAVRNTDGTYLPYGPTCTFQAPKHPTTQVRATQCNDYAVASFSEYIYADLVRDVQAYRFRLFNESQQYDFSVDKSGNSFRLSDFPGLVGGETYSVQVAVRMNGQQDFGNYGKTCTLIIPTIARSMEDTTVGAITFDAQVYPNPFAEQFYFKVASASAADYTIQVYDMLGKLVENRTVSSDSIESTEVGANFPAGVYNVILTQGENIKTLRVVKR